ncbi:MAG: hypothetical protein K2H47_08635 [Muribaculaceae bacterium]|nr:hypothetical protein [Muribaculaceae bacterium]
MKIKKILWITGIVGCFFIGLCILIGWWVFPTEVWWESGWRVFCWLCNILGYIANLAIVAAAVKYIFKETLDIKGIGKFRLRRMQNNIQDITNYISWRLYNGKNFHRNSVLEAFYKDSSIECVDEPYPEYTKLSLDNKKPETEEKIVVDGKEFIFVGSQIHGIDDLTEALKWVLNEGKDLDNRQLTEVYRQWYCVEPSGMKTPVNQIVIDFNGRSYNFVRDKAENIKSLIKAAQYVMNDGQPLDNKTLSEIYKQWYKPKKEAV